MMLFESILVERKERSRSRMAASRCGSATMNANVFSSFLDIVVDNGMLMKVAHSITHLKHEHIYILVKISQRTILLIIWRKSAK
jgi:hypothetical protein